MAHTQSQGPATDSRNAPVIDPTKNVETLVAAEAQRQDDLRIAEGEHIREIIKMQEAHARELRVAEAGRLDAIRAVDVSNFQQATAAAEARATTLAGQVAAAASAQATSLANALEPIKADIADLRRSQYENVGQKTQVVETQAKSSGVGTWVGAGIAACGLFISTGAIFIAVIIKLSGS
jgi:hypothetical protein